MSANITGSYTKGALHLKTDAKVPGLYFNGYDFHTFLYFVRYENRDGITFLQKGVCKCHQTASDGKGSENVKYLNTPEKVASRN